MLKGRKLLLLVIAICTMTILILPTTALANSAEPPSLIILVNNPPEDLSIVLESNEKQPEAKERRVAWEGYYVFYSRDMRVDGKYVFKVTTNGDSFECILNEPMQGYNNVVTLDFSNRELIPGKYPFRSVLLVSIRILLTLLLEGIVFWLFGFRQKRSWFIFLAINLVTQGILNGWLNSNGSPISRYLILSLIIGEFFVFVTEMIAFPILVKEHEKSRILIYVIIANTISLIAGGYIISVLPV